MKKQGILVMAIILLALNLRAPFLVITPLMESIGRELILDNKTMGLLTTIPLFIFGGLSSFIGIWGNRYGVGKCVWIALFMILLGEIIRFHGTAVALFGGTAFIAIGAAIGNVLIPAMIKGFFPDKIGMMTSLYSALMGMATAVSMVVIVPLYLYYGWEWALFLWSLLVFIAMPFWIPFYGLRLPGEGVEQGQDKEAKLVKKEDFDRVSISLVLAQPLAWYISLYMGIQSLLFYCFATWLPTLLVEKGMSVEETGYFAFWFQMISLVMSFIIPLLAARRRDQRYYALVSCACYSLGILGIYYFPVGVELWASNLLLGIGAGATFGIALVYFGVRVQTAQVAAVLSGVGQAIGYILAAVGPVLLGYLKDQTGSWFSGMAFLFIASLLFMLIGYAAGKDRYIEV